MDHVAISNRTGVTADVVSLTQDPGNLVPVQLLVAVILATVAGTVVLEVGGTVPTTTTLATQPCLGGASAAKALAFTNSNSTGGAPITVAYPLAAGVPLVLDLPMTRLTGVGVNRVVTVRVALGSSGNVSSAVYFREY